MLIFVWLFLLQDYHNLRAPAYNSKVRELEAQTAHLAESRRKSLSSFFAGARWRTRGL